MIGIDLVKVDRICKIKNLERIFYKDEIEYFDRYENKYEIIAGHFAVKEAVMKLFDVCKSLSFKDIKVCHNKNGRPYVEIYNLALEEFKIKNYKDIEISISHEKDYAIAIARTN